MERRTLTGKTIEENYYYHDERAKGKENAKINYSGGDTDFTLIAFC